MSPQSWGRWWPPWGECAFVLNHLLWEVTRLSADSGEVNVLSSELTQVAKLKKWWKEFGAFSWVNFVSLEDIVNLASEGDYRVLLFLSFIEIKVCVYMHVSACEFICCNTYEISSSVHSLQESCLPLCTKGEPQLILGSSFSSEYVPHPSLGRCLEQY